jgi:hypothetical protein
MIEKGFILPNGQYIQAIDGNKASLSDYPAGTIEVPLKPGEHYEWDGSQWVELPPPPPTPEEIRSERDFLLKKSDWTQLPDAPVDQTAWAAYRQELRDIPQQKGFPENVTWPTKPE